MDNLIGKTLDGAAGELRLKAVVHAQRPGDDVLLGVMLGFLHGDGAAVHQLLHIGVIMGCLLYTSYCSW